VLSVILFSVTGAECRLTLLLLPHKALEIKKLDPASFKFPRSRLAAA
jgi:hypothetical protein